MVLGDVSVLPVAKVMIAVGAAVPLIVFCPIAPIWVGLIEPVRTNCPAVTAMPLLRVLLPERVSVPAPPFDRPNRAPPLPSCRMPEKVLSATLFVTSVEAAVVCRCCHSQSCRCQKSARREIARRTRTGQPESWNKPPVTFNGPPMVLAVVLEFMVNVPGPAFVRPAVVLVIGPTVKSPAAIVALLSVPRVIVPVPRFRSLLSANVKLPPQLPRLFVVMLRRCPFCYRSCRH